mmetsp:Transcript_2714/g.6509  ORF Transcript_2714/g.6509 Transcript_2714/m.6509 type:complete len:393 (-) Transcript_2714:131-1309(-)
MSSMTALSLCSVSHGGVSKNSSKSPAAAAMKRVLSSGVIVERSKEFHLPKHTAIVGHRGTGKNFGPSPQSMEDFAGDIRENTVLAFTTAALQGADFVELDVQVTKDGVPVIWHDDYIAFREICSCSCSDSIELEEEAAAPVQKKYIPELTFAEFKQLSFLSTTSSKSKQQKSIVLLRRFDGDEGDYLPWICRQEDGLPSLEEVMKALPKTIGINIECKFENDGIDIPAAEMRKRLLAILDCIEVNNTVKRTSVSMGQSNEVRRRLMISSYCPNALIQLSQMRNLFDEYPVMMVTDGGEHMYKDERMNSIEAAHAFVKQYNLNGIVTYSKVLPTHEMMRTFVSEGLKIFSFGKDNSDPVFSMKQVEEMGIHSVIVDDVHAVHRAMLNKRVACH